MVHTGAVVSLGDLQGNLESSRHRQQQHGWAAAAGARRTSLVMADSSGCLVQYPRAALPCFLCLP